MLSAVYSSSFVTLATEITSHISEGPKRNAVHTNNIIVSYNTISHFVGLVQHIFRLTLRLNHFFVDTLLNKLCNIIIETAIMIIIVNKNNV